VLLKAKEVCLFDYYDNSDKNEFWEIVKKFKMNNPEMFKN
jgi:hypothetical protein